jgi:hypothetical protein
MLLSFAVHGYVIFHFQPNGQSNLRRAEASLVTAALYPPSG